MDVFALSTVLVREYNLMMHLIQTYFTTEQSLTFFFCCDNIALLDYSTILECQSVICQHVIKLYDIFNIQAAPHCSETALIHIAHILARIASVEEGLTLLLYGENMNSSEEKWYVSVLNNLWNFLVCFLKSDLKFPKILSYINENWDNYSRQLSSQVS